MKTVKNVNDAVVNFNLDPKATARGELEAALKAYTGGVSRVAPTPVKVNRAARGKAFYKPVSREPSATYKSNFSWFM